jgi:hypothetical protein
MQKHKFHIGTVDNTAVQSENGWISNALNMRLEGGGTSGMATTITWSYLRGHLKANVHILKAHSVENLENGIVTVQSGHTTHNSPLSVGLADMYTLLCRRESWT